MLIIGERINASRESVRKALETEDLDAIVREAKSQIEAGATHLDVNCGTVDAADEPRLMEWLVMGIQRAVSGPLCIDSVNPDALAAGLAVHEGPAIINSISGESERLENMLPMVAKYGASVVALCMDDNGIPDDSSSAAKVGGNLVRQLVDSGIPLDRIYLDPLVRSVAVNPETVVGTLELMRTLRTEFEGLHFVSGLSNVSFGLPERRHLNRAYAVMSVAEGLDAVIMDPLDQTLQALLYAAEALANRDRFCMRYIEAYNNGKLASR